MPVYQHLRSTCLALLLLQFGCSNTAKISTDGCSDDKPCVNTELCVEGACRDRCNTSGECNDSSACVGGACIPVDTDCSGDGICPAGWYCDAVQPVCRKLGDLGQACGDATQCQSGFCVDGVCCDERCRDTCMNCGTGTCALIPLGEDPGDEECPGAAQCDGAGNCIGLPLGAACTVPADCQSNNCAPDGVCCETPCNGLCERCNSAGQCDPVPAGTDTTDDECTDPATCDGARGCSIGSCSPGEFLCDDGVSAPECVSDCNADCSGALACTSAGTCVPDCSTCSGKVLCDGACVASCGECLQKPYRCNEDPSNPACQSDCEACGSDNYACSNDGTGVGVCLSECSSFPSCASGAIACDQLNVDSDADLERACVNSCMSCSAGDILCQDRGGVAACVSSCESGGCADDVFCDNVGANVKGCVDNCTVCLTGDFAQVSGDNACVFDCSADGSHEFGCMAPGGARAECVNDCGSCADGSVGCTSLAGVGGRAGTAGCVGTCDGTNCNTAGVVCDATGGVYAGVDVCVSACSSCSGRAKTCGNACVADCQVANCPGTGFDCDGSCISSCSGCTAPSPDKDWNCNGICVSSCSGGCGGAYECNNNDCVMDCRNCGGSEDYACDADGECHTSCEASCSGQTKRCDDGTNPPRCVTDCDTNCGLQFHWCRIDTYVGDSCVESCTDQCIGDGYSYLCTGGTPFDNTCVTADPGCTSYCNGGTCAQDPLP